MLFILRKIRKALLKKNKFTTYVLYAVGEIVLVVIGIMIAVSLNNWNENQKNRKREIEYLKNIELDLKKDIKNLEALIIFRKDKLKACSELLANINGAPIVDLDLISTNVNMVMMERRFMPNNTTFSELSNSGNLNLISSDSIKVLLLDLINDYARNVAAIEHETFDYREYISKPSTSSLDLSQTLPVYLGQKTAKEMEVKREDFLEVLTSSEYKNGLLIQSMMTQIFIPLYEEIQRKSNRILELIELELSKSSE